MLLMPTCDERKKLSTLTATHSGSRGIIAGPCRTVIIFEVVCERADYRRSRTATGARDRRWAGEAREPGAARYPRSAVAPDAAPRFPRGLTGLTARAPRAPARRAGRAWAPRRARHAAPTRPGTGRAPTRRQRHRRRRSRRGPGGVVAELFPPNGTRGRGIWPVCRNQE